MKLLTPSEYQPIAERIYAELADSILAALPYAQVEHVGASAIPGALSKGDLDICVIVPASKHERAISVLEEMGYRPSTESLRTPELCMLKSSRQEMDIALQVIVRGSEYEFFMHFRDALRANPLLVEQYNRLKYEYKNAGTDIYRAQKARFIQQVLNGSIDDA